MRRPAPLLTDPYEQLGVRVFNFIVKPSVDIVRGYDTNPGHVPGGPGSGFTAIEPTVKILSDWSRHEYGLDLRGSYSDYDKQSSLNRPLFDAKSHSRIDVSRETIINTESTVLSLHRLSGQPQPAGRFRQAADLRELRLGGESDAALQPSRSHGQGEHRADPVSGHAAGRRHHSSNKDRDFNQYGGAVRVSYETLPGVKPFVEVAGDVRKHDLQFDRDGLQRDSQGADAADRHHIRSCPQAHRRGFGRLPGAEV